MSDQCMHCVVRGDIDKCRVTDCGRHESWYALTLQSTIDQLALNCSMLANRDLAIEAFFPCDDDSILTSEYWLEKAKEQQT